MSRAFVKEPDSDSAIDELPDRPISPNRNLITPWGHERIQATLAEWRRKEAATPADDRAAHARIGRELRYWQARVASAEVTPPPAQPEEVRFGCRVTLARADGSRQTLGLVGEDETRPEEGLIAWTAPLAQVLIGLEEGETVRFGDAELEILAIEPLEAD